MLSTKAVPRTKLAIFAICWYWRYDLPQNIHRLIAVPIKCEVERAEGAGVVELGEIDLVGKAGSAPIALLGGVPAMARVATKRNKQQITLIKSRLQVWRDLLIECSSKRKNHGVMPFK